MPQVTFQPLNQTYTARDGESILDVAVNHDVPMQHACGGFCACTTCQVRVISGMEHLSEPEEDETDRLDHVAEDRQPNSRLGCQAKIHGDIVVEIVNLDD